MARGESGEAFQLVLDLHKLATFHQESASSGAVIDVGTLVSQLETLTAQARALLQQQQPDTTVTLVEHQVLCRKRDTGIFAAEPSKLSPVDAPTVTGLGASTSACTGGTVAVSSLDMWPQQHQYLALSPSPPSQQPCAEAPPTIDRSVPDILYVLPLTDVKRYFWDKLSGDDQRSLRCTCRAMQELAQQGLVTRVDSYVEEEEEEEGEGSISNLGASTVHCLTRLLWCVQHYQALQAIHLTQLQLSPLNCNMLKTALRAAPRLQTLIVHAPVRTTQNGLVSIFAALAAAPRLTGLELSELGDLTAAEVHALTSALRSLPHLKHLRLAFGRISDADGADVALMASIAALTALQQLDMESSSPVWRFTPSHMEALTSSPSLLPQLKELTFGLKFQDASLCERLAHWLADGAAPGLEVFGAYNVSRGDELIAQLNLTGAWRAMRNLHRLVMWSSGITDTGVAQLAASALPASFTHVDLSHSGITADGAVALAAALPSWSQLQELKLYNCQLTDAGARAVVEALIRAPHMRQVKEVDLQHCDVSEECAQALHAAWRNAPHLAGARLLLF